MHALPEIMGPESAPWSLPADSEAWGPFLDGYRPYLWLLARRRYAHQGNCDCELEDLVQETLLRALQKRATFRGTTEQEWAGWLRQILLRLAIDDARRKTASARRADDWIRLMRDYAAESAIVTRKFVPVSLSTPSGNAAKRELMVLVAQALDRLPPDYREAIVLRQFENLSLDEAARRMNRSADSVEKLWARGLVQLRRLLRSLS
jgi:RNA polymerase sigma-70 factor (ECF subfamily)